jgi:hypothetical protein
MMEVRFASVAAPDHEANEDFCFAVPGLVGVLDGVTVLDGLDTGCVHGPAWYVRHLAGLLQRGYVLAPERTLPDLLAEAIDQTRADHEGRCDLSHPSTPASTVSLLRETPDAVEYLVLCDSPVVIERGTEVDVVTDGRHAATVARIRAEALAAPKPLDSPEHTERLRSVLTKQRDYTNQPGGYWIAAANPAAAAEAVTGTAPVRGAGRVRRAALLTDGASRAVEEFDLFGWQVLMDVLNAEGPLALIGRVRAAELNDYDEYARPRYKRHDDATAALCLFDGEGRTRAS